MQAIYTTAGTLLSSDNNHGNHPNTIDLVDINSYAAVL